MYHDISIPTKVPSIPLLKTTYETNKSTDILENMSEI